jgi:hypothetical protein
MNRQERDDLLQFLQPLLRTRATDKDFAAETLILEQCARQPDALYLLVQRAMALESALKAAQARIAEQQGALAAQAVKQDAVRDATPARAEPGDRSGAWGRGLLAQASAVGTAVALGVTAGVVAGGLLLDAVDDGFGDDL